MQPEIIEREVGAIVAATGFELLRGKHAQACGYAKHPDVVDGLEFERLLSASGPSGGVVRRPSDGKIPKDVVFIQCVDSRDPEHGMPYCSRICCMYTAKHALLYKHKVHDGRAYVFYMDIRAAGKGYEEFVQRVMEEERVVYIRGRVSSVLPQEGKLKVFGVDTLSGQPMQIDADMVVLATAAVPSYESVASKLRIAVDPYGFFQEAHPKLRPVETLTAGIFLAGAIHSPKDIPDTVAQASAAAAKGMELLSHEKMQREPTTAAVNEQVCMGCLTCVAACPYQAIRAKELRDKQGRLVRLVAEVNPAMCEGCGVCAGVCRVGAVDLADTTDEQIFAQLSAMGPLKLAVGG